MTGRPAGPVFDFHARLIPGSTAAADLLSTMDNVGIDRAAVAAGGVIGLDQLSAQLVLGGHIRTSADNAAVPAACAGTGGRLVPFYFANPYDGVDGYRDRLADFRGLELSPAVYGVGYDDPLTLALVRVAAEAGHPVYTVAVGRPGARVTDLVALARRFPDVSFVFGHCGFTAIDTYALTAITPQPNIVAETSGCMSIVARTALDRLGPERVVFGTEYPLQHPSVELAKYAALDLPAPAWHDVAWRNAHRLLAEEPR